MLFRFRPLVLLAAFVLLVNAPSIARAQARAIDTERSTLTVRVFKAGLFSFAAHDHEIQAPMASGSLAESEKPSVELSVDARQLKVLDPQLAADKRAEVQKTMHSAEVLDSAQFPEIRFRSTSMEKAGEGKWTVRGDLTLHGQTQPVVVYVTGGGGHYRGACAFKQRLFGIKPVSIAGGTIKVKDEVKIEFEIFAR
ncbi:MAG: YceI family protein [Acidobacteria bacterium]|nr:YceI family protein [Acidobacteriota bacterium]